MTEKAALYDVIRKPVVTEKATMASEANAVVFEVAMSANKPTIKEAVETLFGVKVKAVNTRADQRQDQALPRPEGPPERRQKAYVTLEEGNTIDVSTGL